jgi:signal transduction histidine kinase
VRRTSPGGRRAGRFGHTLIGMPRWFPALPDVVFALVALVLTQAELWTVAPVGSLLMTSISFAVGAGAIAFRRVYPLASTITALAGFLFLPSVVGTSAGDLLAWLVVALGMCAWCGFEVRPWWMGLGAILSTGAAAVAAEKGLDLDDTLFAWVLLGGAWLAGRGMGAQASATALERERAGLLAQQAHLRADAAVIEERVRIAREMHDVIAHSLSVLTLHVGGVRRLLKPDQQAERAALTEAERVGRQATHEMHRVLGLLRSPTPEDGPTPSLATVGELAGVTRAAGITVELDESWHPGSVPPGADIAAYRIVQEALTNVRRHASASTVRVNLEQGDAGLMIEVIDDGVGRRGDAHSGHGLTGMAERAKAYGGSVSAENAPGGGFAVRAHLPFGADE